MSEFIEVNLRKDNGYGGERLLIRKENIEFVEDRYNNGCLIYGKQGQEWHCRTEYNIIYDMLM